MGGLDPNRPAKTQNLHLLFFNGSNLKSLSDSNSSRIGWWIACCLILILQRRKIGRTDTRLRSQHLFLYCPHLNSTFQLLLSTFPPPSFQSCSLCKECRCSVIAGRRSYISLCSRCPHRELKLDTEKKLLVQSLLRYHFSTFDKICRRIFKPAYERNFRALGLANHD